MQLIPGELYQTLDSVYLYPENARHGKYLDSLDSRRVNKGEIIMFIARKYEINMFLHEGKIFEGMLGLCQAPEEYLVKVSI